MNLKYVDLKLTYDRFQIKPPNQRMLGYGKIKSTPTHVIQI